MNLLHPYSRYYLTFRYYSVLHTKRLTSEPCASSDWQSMSTNMYHEILQEKCHPAKSLVPSAVCEPSNATSEPHSSRFNQIDGFLIRKIALKMDGAAGPLAINATRCKRLCPSFRTHCLSRLPATTVASAFSL